MKKNKKILIKALIEEKLFLIFFVALFTVVLIFFFEYNFKNTIVNSVLLYFASIFFSQILDCGPIQLYANPFIKSHELNKKKLTSEQYRELDLRLKIEHPKLFVYYRTIMSIELLTKIVAFLMFMYGIAQLM